MVTARKKPWEMVKAGPKPRISDAEIAEVRHRHVNLRVPLSVLAEQTGFSHDSLYRIVSGKRHADAPGPVRPSGPRKRVPPVVTEAIRRELAAGRKQAVLTRKYRVSTGYVSKIARQMRRE